ncbi:metalloprotease PmbA [Vogesella sp. DC21W]|uniref:Metalloprotease PmbA n=1 Tax=Vogesella aquatica TaxID=2984206 RepID=A0ABT5J0G1_9NEIS|nr:metalloprotease PmbA [Vogesella aquatica]MDC7718317.1 metalloprotease PmbA [Vogesella aquatica]
MAEQIFSYTEAALEDIAARMLALARAGGATAAETDVSEGCGQNVSVRLGEVETIEYNRDKGVSLTVYLGQKKGHASTSDFSDKALADTAAAALNIARYTAEDDCAGLADPALLLKAGDRRDLDLYHPWDLPVEQAIALARQCEDVARGVDARISNSEGGSVATHVTRHCYANSHGYSGSLTTSRHSLSASVVASGANSMQRDYWYSTARHAGDLLSAEEVGRIAGERAVRRLDGRRVKTGQYPVLFEAPVAGSLLSHLVQAVSGGSLYRKSSFLLDSLGQQVAAPLLNISEDPFVLRGLASGCADDEGVATSARQFVKDGVLQGYFLGSYSARKLGMQSTGHAGGAHNLVVRPTLAGGLPALLARMGTGLLVTELMGQGINMVTGDYSRGASGFWVENGVIAYPVEELTIAGNLRDMLQGIDAIGDDIDYRGSRHMGSVLLGSMMVAGEA